MFDPRAIAVVGASATEGKLGYEAMVNAAVFDGPVYPVNPSGSGMVFGESFVDSVVEIDDEDGLGELGDQAVEQSVPEVPFPFESCFPVEVLGWFEQRRVRPSAWFAPRTQGRSSTYTAI